MSGRTSIGVNLLPVAVRRQREGRRARVQALMVMGCVVAVLVVVFGWTMIGRSLVESELASAQVRLAAAEAEKRKYDAVPGVYAAIAAARAEISTAMAEEILFSGILANLGQTVPADTSLSSVTLSVRAPDGKTGKAAAPGDSSVGSASFTGQATSMPAVAAALEAFTKSPYYTDVHLDSAQLTTAGGGERVTFTISGKFTEAALSRRFQTDKPGPSPTPSGAQSKVGQ